MTVEICFKPVIKSLHYETTNVIKDSYEIQQHNLIRYILLNAAKHKVEISESEEETTYKFYSGFEQLTYEEITLFKPESIQTINFINHKLKREKKTK